MTQSFQKWFWRITVLVLFMVSLVYVLLQANGFRFDSLTHQFRKTGIIDISYSNPEASVYLDSKKLNGVLPFSITNVLPGEYTVVIAREGYWDYTSKVNVTADLITRIRSVFLVPMYPESTTLWPPQTYTGEGAETGAGLASTGNGFLKEGYFFLQQGGLFKWAKMTGIAPEFQSVTLPGDWHAIKEVRVLGDEAFLIDVEGERAILDLMTGFLKPVTLSDDYRYIGQRWIYLHDDVLAAFERDTDQLLWARQPRLGSTITDVRFFSSGGKEFLALDYAGLDAGELFELRTDELVHIAEGRVTWLEVGTDGLIDYLKSDNTLWSFNPKENRSLLVFRMGAKIKMIVSSWQVFGARRVIFFRDDNGYWLADRGMENSRQLLSVAEADQVMLMGGTLYYLHPLEEGRLELRMITLNK